MLFCLILQGLPPVEARRISMTIRIFKQAVLKKFQQQQSITKENEKEESASVIPLTVENTQEGSSEQKVPLTKCVCPFWFCEYFSLDDF
jgi:hypothetical protein